MTAPVWYKPYRFVIPASHSFQRPPLVSVYRVELDVFKGPLDLLLFLVRRDELDVCNLPVGRIVREFQAFLSVLEFIDLDLAGDFVVTAATLAEIKSRLVLPTAEEEDTQAATVDDADPRTDLIRQLLEYRKYRDAAEALEEHASEWRARYPRLSSDRPPSGNSPASDLIKEVELWDLVSALARVLEKKVIEKESTIRDDDVPIHVHVEQIATRVRAEQKVPFSSLFDQANRRSRIVGVFLAILELLRHHHFRAEQSEDFGEIWVLPPLEIPAAVDLSSQPDAAHEEDNKSSDHDASSSAESESSLPAEPTFPSTETDA